MRAWPVVVLVLLWARETSESSSEKASSSDASEALGQLAAARACDRIEGAFEPLVVGDATGALRIARCAPEVEGARLVVRIEATGWAAAPRSVHAVLRGALAWTSDRARGASVQLASAGWQIEGVDHAAAGPIERMLDEALFGRAPTAGGARELCGALSGEPVAAPREVALAPGGATLVGPVRLGRAATLRATSDRAARVTLVCAEHAEAIAARLAAEVPSLVSADLAGEARIRLPAVRCPVVVIVRSLGDRAVVRWQWEPAAPAAAAQAKLRCRAPAGAARIEPGAARPNNAARVEPGAARRAGAARIEPDPARP
ncbi:MAG: hypothetical protein ACTHU0_30090, partial [Kofleriaceae bacterium]